MELYYTSSNIRGFQIVLIESQEEVEVALSLKFTEAFKSHLL
jgi:hypothetical protein